MIFYSYNKTKQNISRCNEKNKNHLNSLTGQGVFNIFMTLKNNQVYKSKKKNENYILWISVSNMN